MAFSATIREIQYVGPGRRIISGDWSGAAGDAAGTFTCSGTVVSSRFEKFDADNTFALAVLCSASTASGVTRLTVNNLDNVTTGYFTLEVRG